MQSRAVVGAGRRGGWELARLVGGVLQESALTRTGQCIGRQPALGYLFSKGSSKVKPESGDSL